MIAAVRFAGIVAAVACASCSSGDPRSMILHPDPDRQIADADLEALADIDDMVFDHRRASAIGRYQGATVRNVDPCQSDYCGWAGPLDIVLEAAIRDCTSVGGVIEIRQYNGEGSLPARQVCVPIVYSTALRESIQRRWNEQRRRSLRL